MLLTCLIPPTSSETMVRANQIDSDFDSPGAPPGMQVLHLAEVQSFQEPQATEPYSSVHCQQKANIKYD